MNNEIYVGSDHAGYAFKVSLLEQLKKHFPNFIWADLGCHSEESCDYPEFAAKVADAVVKQSARGILICGSGIGVAIAANKVPGIRAATIWDAKSASLSKEHNNTNIIAMGARLITLDTALAAVTSWLNTEFAGGRHQKRIDLITSLEKKYGAS
ncbi:MAG: ribose 5-phosphate isomerase B [Proteobacteria bacterium]|nr:ribose 5-phosphate isomerase B [Pseudomonadota bacterium]